MGLHLKLVSPTSGLRSGVLTLPNASSFTVTIKEYEDEMKRIEKEFQDEVNVANKKKDERRLQGWTEERLEENWKANKKIIDDSYRAKHKKITDLYNTVQWVWSLVPQYKSQLNVYNHNELLNPGLNEQNNKKFNFPELIVGGGLAYVEAFFPDQKPVGKAPNGIFVKATGKPAFVRAEWTDFRYNPLNDKELAYGSEVLLHIYTTALYGEDIEVKLFDKEKILDDAINIADQWAFKRKIDAETIHDFELGKPGVSNALFNAEKHQAKEDNTHIQKVEIKVKIDEYWASIAKSFWSGTNLDLFPKVYHKDKELKILKDTKYLKIREKGTLYDEPAEITNQPVLVEDYENTYQNDLKTPVDFTFGVFLDGTLNNMYNTEIRQKVEESRTGKSNLTDPTGLSPSINAEEIYRSKSSKKVFNNPSSGESSFENDLSNPAILFKNYEANFTTVFKVYTEGIGTNSAPKQPGADLAKEDYKDDDIMQGPAFGMGSSGITDNVRKAIRDVASYILQNISKKNNTVGTITFDVFGFSRGAAAARHFVHIVKHSAYKPTQYASGKDTIAVKDIHGYNVPNKYYNQLMPQFGLLGQLLNDEELYDLRTNVVVRFVGIYDTVPHHGLFQWNDIKDLGLDSVNKAEYVVHMVADDEHRANFSLADISSVAKAHPDSGNKGGMELHYPGVHCDVGGAYVEGWYDNPLRIDAEDTEEKLKPLLQELIKQGWFNNSKVNSLNEKINELYIIEDKWGGANLIGNVYRLEGKRKLSNQYSFIPLHIMAEFCKKRNVKITSDILLKSFNFKNNFVQDNINFLNKIKSKLKEYSFNGGDPIKFNESDSENKNETIKFLRNHYLHWNSQYGEKGIDIAVQKNYPNKVNGQRKRHIR